MFLAKFLENYPILTPATFLLTMQALDNAEREDTLGMKISSLPASLFAFPWEITPQGYNYWRDVFERAEAGEFG